MRLVRVLATFLTISLVVDCASCHRRGGRGGVWTPNDGRNGDLVVGHVKRYAANEEENAVLDTGTEKKGTASRDKSGKGGTSLPFSERRLEKMLEKAILKIITGDLSAGDMLLLKSLNYSLEEVLAIRERELTKRKDEESRRKESARSWTKSLHEDGERRNRYRDKNTMDRFSSKATDSVDGVKVVEEEKARRVDKSLYKDFDFDAYNRQAILDYESLPPNVEFQSSLSESTAIDYEETTKASEEQRLENNLRRDFDKAMEPHVVFKIRYDDSEFDSSSGSDESTRNRLGSSGRPSIARHVAKSSGGDSFHASTSSAMPSTTVPAVPLVYQLSSSNGRNGYPSSASSLSIPSSTTDSVDLDEASTKENGTSSTEKNETKGREGKKVSEYEGLEWVEDDVYRVLPEFVDSLDFENSEDNQTIDYYPDSRHDSPANWTMEENENDTMEYQNDGPSESVKLLVNNGNASASNLSLANLSTYLQVAIAHRRGGNLSSSFDSQGEKAIEDIKSRVLALTGRFNLSSSANQVQHERLTMFSPTCQIPRNTDQDAWTDPFSMNMHFQLNLTSSDHVVAAKLRLFKLPQENLTFSSEGSFDEEEEDEKKIRISVYYYTKSLKRHRSKKRLMDSVVTPLTSKGTHLALDVRQSLRYWRLNPRNVHGSSSNHGLVIQVEDQDGRPLKPALYIQQPSCGENDSDQKAYQRIPALFIRACTRYVRVVDGKTETYVNCRH